MKTFKKKSHKKFKHKTKLENGKEKLDIEFHRHQKQNIVSSKFYAYKLQYTLHIF